GVGLAVVVPSCYHWDDKESSSRRWAYVNWLVERASVPRTLHNAAHEATRARRRGMNRDAVKGAQRGRLGALASHGAGEGAALAAMTWALGSHRFSGGSNR